MKNTIITIALVTIGFISFTWWGSSAQKPIAKPNLSTKNVLTVSENLYDFGTISMKNGNVTKDFTVTNSSNKDIFIPSLVTSCMCTKAFIVEPGGTTKGPFSMPSMGYVPPANETIRAGDNRIIRVVYDPNAHGPAGVGQIDRTITLTDAPGNALQLEIKALVTP